MMALTCTFNYAVLKVGGAKYHFNKFDEFMDCELRRPERIPFHFPLRDIKGETLG
jgi:hypothetical protein